LSLGRGAASVSGRGVPLSQQGFGYRGAPGRTNAPYGSRRFRPPRPGPAACPLRSDRRTKPFPLSDLDPRPAHLGIVRHGGEEEPYSTMICGYFSLSRPSRSSVLELLPPILRLSPAAEQDWLETILQRMVRESAIHRPGQGAVLSRMTEMLFIEVLRSWMKSL